MPAPRIELELSGLAEAVSMLDAIFGRTQDFKPLLEEHVADGAREFMVDQFATSGAAGGEPWAPLSKATLAIRASEGYGGGRMLRRTDTLYNSLTKRDAPYGVQSVDQESLQIGTSDPVAVALETGEARMPPRQIIPDDVPAQYADKWDALVLDYVEGH